MFRTKVVEKNKTHILCSVTLYFLIEDRTLYEIRRKDSVEPDRSKVKNGICALHAA